MFPLKITGINFLSEQKFSSLFKDFLNNLIVVVNRCGVSACVCKVLQTRVLIDFVLEVLNVWIRKFSFSEANRLCR